MRCKDAAFFRVARRNAHVEDRIIYSLPINANVASPMYPALLWSCLRGSLKKALVLRRDYRPCACITIIIVREGKGRTERTMGIGVFSYVLSTHVSARACRIPACLAAEVTHRIFGPLLHAATTRRGDLSHVTADHSSSVRQ